MRMTMTSAINGETCLVRNCMILMTKEGVTAVAVTMGADLLGAEGMTATTMIIDQGSELLHEPSKRRKAAEDMYLGIYDL